MKVLNWGVVSAGRICDQFAEDMVNVGNGKILGVAARKLDDANKFADKHDIERRYEGYQALFDDPDIDVVYIGTPHTVHFQNAYDAIMAGKHVLCEKPMTVSSKQCRTLCAIAKGKNVFLMEALWTYFLPAIIQAKKWVEEGRIGDIKHIKADFGYPMPYDPNTRVYNAELAGGCLLDMGIYPIALAGYFLDENLDYTYVSANKVPNGVEDDVIMQAESGDIKVSLATSFQCKLNNKAYIQGDKGSIVIDDFWRAHTCSLYEVDVLVDQFSDERTTIGYNYEAEAIGEAILDDTLESKVVPHKRSLWLQEQMEHVSRMFKV